MASKVHTFAYFADNPVVSILQRIWPANFGLAQSIFKSRSVSVSPLKVFQLKKIQFRDGDLAQGYVVCCPALSGQQKSPALAALLERIREAGVVSGKLGARILGLSSCFSLAGDRAQQVSRKLKLPITTGNAFSAWTVFESVYRMARFKEIRLEDATLTIAGVNNPLAVLCAQKFSGYVRRILLCGQDRAFLENLRDRIKMMHACEVSISDSASLAVNQSDIVVIADDIQPGELNLEGIKPNSIVCDVSLYKQLTKKKSFLKNVTVVEAGLVKVPSQFDLRLSRDYPRNVVPAPLAEVMLLAFEERYTSYSLGENTNLDKLEEIANIAARHGFEVWVPQAPLI